MEDRVPMMTNEGLAIEIKNVQLAITDLKGTVAGMGSSFVTNEVNKLQIDAIQTQIDLIKSDLIAMRRSKWVQNTLSATLGAILAVLISYFVTHFGQK